MREEKKEFLKSMMKEKFGLPIKVEKGFCQSIMFKMYTPTGILLGETGCNELDPSIPWDTRDSVFGSTSGCFMNTETKESLKEIKEAYFAAFPDAVRIVTEDEKREDKKKILTSDIKNIKEAISKVEAFLKSKDTVYRCPDCEKLLLEEDIIKLRRCIHCDTIFSDTDGKNCPGCNRPFSSIENERACPNCENPDEEVELIAAENLEKMLVEMKSELKALKKEYKNK